VHIELRNIHFSFGGSKLLNDVNMFVEDGECIAISGGSGSGKSLLFSILCGTLKTDKGQVLANGQDLRDMSSDQNQAFRKTLGAVFQRSALLSNLSLEENLMLPLNLHFPALTQTQKLERVKNIADEFGFSRYLHWRIDRISVGMTCLAGLARALVIEPKCLIWDAPLIDVDQIWNNLVKTKLRQAKDAGATIIIFSNRKDIIDELADRQFVLSEARLRLKHAA